MDESTYGNLELAKKLIYSVDLNSSIERLIKVHKWKKKQAIAASHQYRNYLFLKMKYGANHVLPPSYDMDEFWHAHILHTQEYCDFCDQVFGGYLHHHPHHGKDYSITDAELEQAFENQTQKLYRLEFGEDIIAIKPLPFRVIIKRFIGFFKINIKTSTSTASNMGH